MATTINVKHGNGNETLVSQSGLLSIGALLKSINFAGRFKNLPDVHCVDPKISHGEILSSMIGFICVGKPDYSAIEILPENTKPIDIVPLFEKIPVLGRIHGKKKAA